MDAMIDPVRHYYQSDSETLETGSHICVDKDCVSEMACEETDAYEYVWLSGDEQYMSDKGQDDSGTTNTDVNVCEDEGRQKLLVEYEQACAIVVPTATYAERCRDSNVCERGIEEIQKPLVESEQAVGLIEPTIRDAERSFESRHPTARDAESSFESTRSTGRDAESSFESTRSTGRDSESSVKSTRSTGCDAESSFESTRSTARDAEKRFESTHVKDDDNAMNAETSEEGSISPEYNYNYVLLSDNDNYEDAYEEATWSDSTLSAWSEIEHLVMHKPSKTIDNEAKTAATGKFTEDAESIKLNKLFDQAINIDNAVEHRNQEGEPNKVPHGLLTNSNETDSAAEKGIQIYSQKAHQQSGNPKTVHRRSRRKRMKHCKNYMVHKKSANKDPSNNSVSKMTSGSVKPRKKSKKSKQSDILRQDTFDFLSRFGLAEANEDADRGETVWNNRSSGRLAQKEKVNYQVLMQGSPSITSSFTSQGSATCLGQVADHCDVNDPVESTADTDDADNARDLDKLGGSFQGKKQNSLLDSSSQQRNGDKWKKIMPTPTSRKRSTATKDSSKDIQREDTLSVRSRPLPTSTMCQSSISHMMKNVIVDKHKPIIVLEKIDKKMCLEDHTYNAKASAKAITGSKNKPPQKMNLRNTGSRLKKSRARKLGRPKRCLTRKILNEIDFSEAELEHQVLNDEKCRKRTAKSAAGQGKSTGGRGSIFYKARRGKKMFPCKYCGQVYSKPYLYSHQKAHRQRRGLAPRIGNRHDRQAAAKTAGPGRGRWRGRAGPKLRGSRSNSTSSSVRVASSLRVASPVRVASPIRVASPKGVITPVAYRTYGCQECSYRANSQFDFRKHQNLHEQSETVTCEACNVVFKHWRALKIWHTKNNINHSEQEIRVLSKGLKKKCTKRDRSVRRKADKMESYPIMEDDTLSNLNRIEALCKLNQDSNNFATENTDANNNAVENIGGRVMKTSATKGIELVDENANTADTPSKAGSSSLACVSCDFVATSFETLGTHFVANHFLGSGNTDVNNNSEGQVSDNTAVSTGHTEWDGFPLGKEVAGGFAKKYNAKKQKNVYAIINKPPQGSETEHTSNASSDYMGSEKEHVSGSQSRNLNLRKALVSDENNNIDLGVSKEKTDKMGASRKYSKKEKNDFNNNVEARQLTNSGGSIDMELLTCLVCQSSFPLKADLLKHLTRIHRLTNLCQLCYFRECQIMRFANPVSLRNHKLRTHPDDMVKCVCGAMLIDEKMLQSHLKKFKCDQSEKETDRPEMVKCVCGKRFGSNDLLAAHKMKCRKRSHSEDSLHCGLICDTSSCDRSSVSGTGQGISASDKYTVASPAYNTRSLQSTTDDDVGSHADSSSNLVYKRQLRERKPYQYGMSGDEELVQSPQVETTVFKKKRSYFGDKEQAKDKPVKPFPECSAFKETNKQNTKTSLSKPEQNTKTLLSKPEHKAAGKKKTGPRRKRPDAEGKYPCKVCKRRFKRPYLYVHQKNAHQKKQWVLVPTGAARPKAGADRGMTYRCGWCKFVSVHWRTVVYHHYSKHQDMELDVITMVTKPSKSQE